MGRNEKGWAWVISWGQLQQLKEDKQMLGWGERLSRVSSESMLHGDSLREAEDGGQQLLSPYSEPSIGLGALNFRVGKNKSLYPHKRWCLACSLAQSKASMSVKCWKHLSTHILLMVQRGRSVGCSVPAIKGACTGKVGTVPIISWPCHVAAIQSWSSNGKHLILHIEEAS